MDAEESVAFAKKYLEDLLSFFGLNTEVSTHVDDEVIELTVPSTYLNGFLIGQRGETLRSLQFLVATTLKNKEAALSRVNIDVAGYKKQRNERLAMQAIEWAKEVMETKVTKALPPMNAAERRVVHQALSDYGQLTSESEGEGRDRHIVLAYKDAA